MSFARTYLITGSSGIGAATAESLAQTAGTQIFLVSKDEGSCNDLSSRLGACGIACQTSIGDLTSPGFAAHCVDACVRSFGRIDALFNVAGGSGRAFGDGPIESCTDEGWDRTFALNATTQFRMCRAALQQMKLQKPGEDGLRGSVLNMASILALDPAPAHFNTVAYAASKGAVIAMTQTIAAAMAVHGIRVNAVAPGLAKTPMSQRALDDAGLQAFIVERQPLLGGMLDSTDVAALCAFLLRPDSRGVTGQIVKVDGGWSAS